MEAVIEKECSALGGLFQTIISDMKVGRRGRGRGAQTWLRSFASARGQGPGPCLRGGRQPPEGALRPGFTCSPGAPLWALLGHRAGGFSRGF